MLNKVKTTAKVAAAGFIASAALSATNVASAATLAETYKLTDVQKRALVNLFYAPKSAPGIGIDVPVGFGASFGDIYTSIGGVTTEDEKGDSDLDGSMTVGFGLGDAQEFVGLEIQANVISLSNNAENSDFGEEGSVSVKLSRNVGATSAISVGAENVSTWGDSLDETDASAYVAFTTLKALSSNPSNPLVMGFTIGLGSERFEDLQNNVRDENSIGLFGSLSLAVHRQVGLIADYNGNYANAGISVVPLRNWPLTVTLSAINVNEVAAEDGGTSTGDTEFGGSLGYSWRF